MPHIYLQSNNKWPRVLLFLAKILLTFNYGQNLGLRTLGNTRSISQGLQTVYQTPHHYVRDLIRNIIENSIYVLSAYMYMLLLSLTAPTCLPGCSFCSIVVETILSAFICEGIII